MDVPQRLNHQDIEGCWNNCFKKIRNYAYSLYSRLGSDALQAAEDATCNAFLKLMEVLIRAEQDIEHCCAWLRAVVLNDFRNRRRALLRQPVDPLPEGDGESRGLELSASDPATNPVTMAERNSALQALIECFQGLTVEHQSVILLYSHGVAKTAEILGKPENTVISRRHMARHNLKRCLKTKGVDGYE